MGAVRPRAVATMVRAEAGESHATVTVPRARAACSSSNPRAAGSSTSKSGRMHVIRSDGASSMNGPNDVVKASPGRIPNKGPTTSRWAARAPWVYRTALAGPVAPEVCTRAATSSAAAATAGNGVPGASPGARASAPGNRPKEALRDPGANRSAVAAARVIGVPTVHDGAAARIRARSRRRPAEASATTGTAPTFHRAAAATSSSALGGTSTDTRSPGRRPPARSACAATDDRASSSAHDSTPSGPS